MNPQLINRLINLVKKTGQPIVLGDQHSDDAIVVLDFNQYEQLLELNSQPATEQQPEPYDSNLKKEEPVRDFPAKDTRRNHRPEETLEMVLEQQPVAATATASTNNQSQKNIEQNKNRNLTADAPAVNINREIASEPNDPIVQNFERKPKGKQSSPSVNQSNVQSPKNEPQNDVAQPSGLDDEERFYLEPLE